MMVTALLMRPWIMEMRTLGMKMRILADDLQIIRVGPRHLRNFVDAFDQTHEHLHAMGAKIAAGKSLTFSSNDASRKWLRNHR